MKTYPGEREWGRDANIRYVGTGQRRPPRKGEYYLSGAIVIAYRAPNDLETPFEIAREATKVETHCPCCGQRNRE